MTIALICPLCRSPLQQHNRQWQCANNHSFDQAKQGHINLLPVQQKRSKQPGDSKEMVAARTAWLSQGHYQPIADQLAALVAPHSKVLDAGCGDGYYLQQLLAAKPLTVVGNDISKFAAAAAAKLCPEAQIIVASNKDLPIEDHSLDAVLCVFGFPVLAEFERILKPNGQLILVHSTEQHLLALRQHLYPQINDKPAKALPEQLVCQAEHLVEYTLSGLSSEQVQALAMMTPHWFRAKQAQRQQLLSNPPASVEVSVKFQVCEFRANTSD